MPASIERRWTRVYRNSLYYYLCDFSINLELFQNKKLLNARTKTCI